MVCYRARGGCCDLDGTVFFANFVAVRGGSSAGVFLEARVHDRKIRANDNHENLNHGLIFSWVSRDFLRYP